MRDTEGETAEVTAEKVIPDNWAADRAAARETLSRLMEKLGEGGEPPAGYMPRQPTAKLSPDEADTLKRIAGFFEIAPDKAIGRLLSVIRCSADGALPQTPP